MLARMWKKGNFCALLVGLQTGTATMENNMKVPNKKKKIGLPSTQKLHFWVFILRKPKLI